MSVQEFSQGPRFAIFRPAADPIKSSAHNSSSTCSICWWFVLRQFHCTSTQQIEQGEIWPRVAAVVLVNCAHSLLPPVKSCTRYLRPKGHTYELPRCDSEVYKCHLYPVASFGICICNLYLCFVWYLRFYILLPLSYLNCRPTCTFDICFIKDQSINQSINQQINQVDAIRRQK